MIQTKEEIFLAEMGIHTQAIIEGDYTAKYKLKDLLKEYAEQCNIANVGSSTEHKKYMVWDELFGILAWKFRPTKSGDMYLDGEKVYNELKDKFELKLK